MENLKEIDLLLMAVPEDIHDNAWVQNAIKMLRDIAEIAKENEPVAWMNPCNGVTIYNGMKTLHPDRYQNFSIPCFPFPPSTEQIENRVAEACAKLLDTQWNGDADTYAEAEIANQCAESIRSGAWKEFIK